MIGLLIWFISGIALIYGIGLLTYFIEKRTEKNIKIK